MRHRKAVVKLGRTSSHRKAMFRNMVTSLFKYERIKTTDKKAKELRGWADHIITLAKRGDLHSRRQALSIVREKNVVHKLFDEVVEIFGERNGGYTRIIKIGLRPGDAAPMSIIELVKERVRRGIPAGVTKPTVERNVSHSELKDEQDLKRDISTNIEEEVTIEDSVVEEKFSIAEDLEASAESIKGHLVNSDENESPETKE